MSRTKRWGLMAAAGVSISLVSLDQSVLPVTLPTIQRELGFSEGALQWSVNTYLLALAVFVLAGGRLGDMYGHRRVFSLGLIFFAFASAACALSYTTATFLASRVLQGIGGAMITPTVPALLAGAFPAEHRGKVFGLYISISAFFISLGPLVGGLLTEYFTWRYVFWINIPLVALGLIITFLTVGPSPKKKESFDFLGFFTIVFGFGSIITALMQGNKWGWLSWPVLSLSIGGIALLCALLFFDRKVKAPFVDLSLFRKKSFTAGVLCTFSAQFILILTVFWAIFFQKILNYTPALAGFWTMLASSPVIAVGALSGHLFDRYGSKLPISLGLSFIIVALSWFIFIPTPHDAWSLLPIIIPFGCGIPMVLIPSFSLFLTEITAHNRGIAVGISTTLRQLAATLGMAILGAIFVFRQGTIFRTKLAEQPETSQLDPYVFDGLLTRSQNALDALQGLPSHLADKIHGDFVSSTIAASTTINIVGLVVAVISLLLVIFFLPWGHFKTNTKH